jgi:hypothetical protein
MDGKVVLPRVRHLPVLSELCLYHLFKKRYDSEEKSLNGSVVV